ncbi:MAG: hypothetical protein AMJ70_07100 [Dehalococcoidia bacterium SG8_51_3]|nr:MAG: hypothetical protein AMJ70_07100 [Dehalococcoidia bacterium SG8_51_3]
MKKILLISLVALLVITGGMFAYTFTTATATIGVAAPTSDFANITAGSGITAPTVFGKFTGTWPSSTLFDITPTENYTGDLVITVYMVNTGELTRQYHHVNMSVEFQDSTNSTADEQGTIQVLNLQNAEVLFTWENGTGTSPYKVVLTGGGYRLHPFKTLTGGSYQPQIWCEVTQR